MSNTILVAVLSVILIGATVESWRCVKNPPRGDSRAVNVALAVACTGMALFALISLFGVITGG